MRSRLTIGNAVRAAPPVDDVADEALVKLLVVTEGARLLIRRVIGRGKRVALATEALDLAPALETLE